MQETQLNSQVTKHDVDAWVEDLYARMVLMGVFEAVRDKKKLDTSNIVPLEARAAAGGR